MDNKDLIQDKMVEEFWRTFFTDGPPIEKFRRNQFYRMLPSDSRCKFCQAPFEGLPGAFVKNVFHTYPSRYNPHYCNVCDDFSKKHQGGAEIPMTMLFADIRSSSGLAEKIGPKDFSDLINRFFVKSAHVLTGYGAMIEKLVGDEVTAVFTSGTAGKNYQEQSIEAAKDLLRKTGHGNGKKPWVEIGIGIHSGIAFLGSIGNPDGIMEVAALGEVPNIASRLTSLAGPGEILVSEDTIKAANLDSAGLEKRDLKLKGHEREITAFVLNVS
jgi:adenylate cyclase